MPTAKGKGASTSQRYRPASEYDDAALAQKREYWRTKKREQRARLSEGKGTQHKGGNLLNSSASSPSPALSLRSNRQLQKTASSALQSGSTFDESSLEGAESRKKQWFQATKLYKVMPHLAATCSITARAAAGNALTGLKAKGTVNRAITSPTSSGNQLDNSSSVPPVKVARYTNGSSTKATPTPRVSMQGPSVPKMQHNEQSALRIQPKLLTNRVTTGALCVSSTCGAVSVKPEGETKGASVTNPRAGGNERPSLESEEERAAKRREQWRIKKREQRAKLAARIAKARERMLGLETAARRQPAIDSGAAKETGLQHPSSQTFSRGVARKHCAIQAKPLFTSVKRENVHPQSRAASLAAGNLHANQSKVQIPLANRSTQTSMSPDVVSAKVTVESQRKGPSYVSLSSVVRGIARCKTPRMRFIESQKNSLSQRNIRYKSLLVSSVFDTRDTPKIDPNDTPEQVIAKRREYWRIKKREQRANLSMEVKARLKEKDSLTRRVKRYQKILDDLKKARALTTQTGSSHTHASETIGGFIKEDGTVSNTLPRGQTDHSAAAKKSKEETDKIIPITQSQPQLEAESICPALVKVASAPLAGQLKNKASALRPQHKSSTSAHRPSLTISQLRLTHPKNALDERPGQCAAGSSVGGCVMKMAVSSTPPSSGPTKEERMAKKREYWRLKKREQRAARAARLKQGALHARAALQRRKAQKQLALVSVQLGKSLSSHTGSAQPSENREPVLPLKNEIKQESESIPAEINSQSEQATCADVEAPAFSPPVTPQEMDSTLSGDSHAATLLAVASMKKLLEESLSTVTETTGQQTDIKVEPKEENLEQNLDNQVNLPLFFLGKDELAPNADLKLDIKNWQPDSDALAQTGSLSPQDFTLDRETPPPPHTSSEVVPHPGFVEPSQATTDRMGNPPSEDAGDILSPRTAQRLQLKKLSPQNCSSVEPPRLHHLPIDKTHSQQQPCERPCQAQGQCQRGGAPPTPLNCGLMMKQSSLTSLQRKREYWKLMKRQQRARLKARQKEAQEEPASGEVEAPGLLILNSQAKLHVQQRPLKAPPPSVHPTTYNGEQSPDTRQLINSVSCSFRSEQNQNTGSSQMLPNCLRDSGGRKQASHGPHKWMSISSDIDSAPSLPSLTPPENPLSCINLQPIELPAQTSNPSFSPIGIPCTKPPSPSHAAEPLAKLPPTGTMVPPKPVPGETEEDFLRRKREYWRIKKKEQRARKAIRDKGSLQRRSSENWRPIMPTQNFHTQVSGQWENSFEESDRLLSSSLDNNLEPFPRSNYIPPVEEGPDVAFPNYENNDGEESPVSDAVWRNRYLMDYDPLNQLLVCIVCGDLQYSHSLEGVRAHIDEAHPDTLSLEAGERQRILDAWDEQVSQRERFFTSQLQQHSGALADIHRN